MQWKSKFVVTCTNNVQREANYTNKVSTEKFSTSCKQIWAPKILNYDVFREHQNWINRNFHTSSTWAHDTVRFVLCLIGAVDVRFLLFCVFSSTLYSLQRSNSVIRPSVRQYFCLHDVLPFQPIATHLHPSRPIAPLAIYLCRNPMICDSLTTFAPPTAFPFFSSFGVVR